jgi:hypothetical protein
VRTSHRGVNASLSHYECVLVSRGTFQVVLDGYPKLVAIDEEADHQVVHGRRFGKAKRTAYETLDPCP